MNDEAQAWGERYLWDLLPDSTVRLLRVYASGGAFQVPAQIQGRPVTVIGAYCFADSEHLDRYELQETVSGGNQAGYRDIPLLSGEAVSYLYLPDSVHTIEDLACYGCSKMRTIEIGAGLQNLGSDVFMNCRELEEIAVRCGIEESSGANVLLNRISSEILLHYLGGNSATEAKLLYPEYLETYDEITPAHIFGRNITGEGFRARQLFAEGMVQLSRYDEIFEKAATEESLLTSGRMALLRLLYPAGLRTDQEEVYRKHVQANAAVVAVYYIDRRDLMVLQKMCEKQYLAGSDLEEAIRYSISAEWSEGSAALMEWKQRYDRTDRRNRYSFDEF